MIMEIQRQRKIAT